MTYTKPAGVRYVDMAIYVDSHIYEDDCDIDTCYQYLYHLFYMIAYKKRFFKKAKDYDEFALYGASQLCMRYRNKKQYTEDEAKRLPKIKSCLNYIKRVAYPLKINFQQGTFAEVFNDQFLEEEALNNIRDQITQSATPSIRGLTQADTCVYLKEIPLTIRNFLKEIPYSRDKLAMHHIYVSCLLTLLDQITLSNKGRVRLGKRSSKAAPSEYLVSTIYREERTNEPILFHLPPSMGNYILTLVGRIKSLIAKDLRYLLGTNEPPEDIVKSILASPMVDYIEVTDIGQ